MSSNKNRVPSIFSKDNDFSIVLAASYIAKDLSSDPLNNGIVTEAINRALGLTDFQFAEAVKISAEPSSVEDVEDDNYNATEYKDNFEEIEEESYSEVEDDVDDVDEDTEVIDEDPDEDGDEDTLPISTT